tara:strand:+ start:2626 stop:3321 length:696 start_codon:yes stop_codon:yes gene_type:complete
MQLADLSVVIPVYNEEKNIFLLIDEVIKTVDKNCKNFEIVVVNDASTDNTVSEFKKKNYPKIVRLINNYKNYGQSKSIYEGVKASKYNIIVTLDGDGQNNPININDLVETYILNPNICLVGGIRKKRNDNYWRLFISRIANSIRTFILDDKCIDTGCGLKVFNREIFLQLPYFNGIHRYLPALFLAKGCITKFQDVQHRPRLNGYSKYGTLSRGLKGIRDLIKVVKIIKKN